MTKKTLNQTDLISLFEEQAKSLREDDFADNVMLKIDKRQKYRHRLFLSLFCVSMLFSCFCLWQSGWTFASLWSAGEVDKALLGVLLVLSAVCLPIALEE